MWRKCAIEQMKNCMWWMKYTKSVSYLYWVWYVYINEMWMNAYKYLHKVFFFDVLYIGWQATGSYSSSTRLCTIAMLVSEGYLW